MPAAQNNSAVDPRRIAALLAGFDTGNASDEEALAKGLALRRIAMKAGRRIVDLIELPDVKQAIDDQMRPNRKESPALQDALDQAAELQEELTERTHDVRQLVEQLRQEEEKTEELSRELALLHRAASTAPSPSRASAPAVHVGNGVPGNDGWMVAAAAVLAIVLLIAAIFGGHFHEGSQGNGLGNGQRLAAPGVHQGGAVRPLPKHGPLRHRVRRGGAPDRTR